MLVKATIWYSVRNAIEGAYPIYFLKEEESEFDQETSGWRETCNGMIETFIGSNVYNQAINNSRDQKNYRNP